MSRYINPFTDFGFKKLFGTEINKDLLIDFLNTILPEESRITTLTFLTTEQLGEGAFDRKAVFDVYCENERGEKFIVEMQKAEQDYFKDRSIFYSTFKMDTKRNPCLSVFIYPPRCIFPAEYAILLLIVSD